MVPVLNFNWFVDERHVLKHGLSEYLLSWLSDRPHILPKIAYRFDALHLYFSFELWEAQKVRLWLILREVILFQSKFSLFFWFAPVSYLEVKATGGINLKEIATGISAGH